MATRRKPCPREFGYDRIALPAPLTWQVMAAAATANLTLIRYVEWRLSPIIQAIITANNPTASEADRKQAQGVLKRAPKGIYRGANGAKPRAIMFNPATFQELAYAAQLEEILPHELLHKYLVPVARQDLKENLKRLLEQEPA